MYALPMLVIVALLVLVTASCAQTGPVFTVSPQGNDSWSGTLDAPNAAGDDGPFASLTRAQKAARQAGPGATVQVRGGTYALDGPVVFTPEDSGTEGEPTTYAAYPGEKPVFTGGSPITGWRKGEGNLWVAEVPEVREGRWYFHQLFVNGARRTRARTPNEGYLAIADNLVPMTDRSAARSDNKYKIGFKFQPGDIQQWENLEDVQIVLYHSWTASLHWIDSVDMDKRELKFTNRCGWPVGYWDGRQRYHVENCFEALDSPGEWYLNRETGMLYYWPMDGEDMTAAQVIAPRIQHLVEIRGDAELGLPVSHLIIRGMSLQHADWMADDRQAVLDGQAAVHLSAAVVASGARDCTIEDCEIAHVGEYAMILGEGCKRNTVRRCHIHDLGGGGVRLGMTDLPNQPERRSEYNTVDNCFIHDGGHVFRAGIGVWIGRSSYNTVSHNEICDFYYSGCSVGWSWGYAPSTAHHNVFEYNHIHNLGKNVLSDMGGIYSLGISPGTVERFNLIHDVFSYSYGGWGLYTDEGSSEILMENNICYNCKTGAFHQHYGRDNTIRNNIFAFSSHTPDIIRSRQEEHSSFTIERNIVLTSHGEPLGGNWGNGNYTIDRNLYWDINGIDLDFAGMEFEEWQALGRDVNSLVADPLFVDAPNYDFRLKENSPAFKLGFQSFDVSDIGLYGDAEWVALPSKVVRPVLDLPEPPKPQPLDDDFEDIAVGDLPGKGAHIGTAEQAFIRVTDETAASGSRSLKFTDGPNFQHEWQPHLTYSPTHTKGTVRMSFDVRTEPGAIFWHEWRDASSPYKVGPSLRIEANGDLKVGGKTLISLQHGQWAKLTITCPLGKDAGTWDLDVQVQDGPTVSFEGLKTGTADWRRLQWMGFISLAKTETVLYIDNLKLEPVK